MKKNLFQMFAVGTLAAIVMLSGCSKSAGPSSSQAKAAPQQTVKLGISIYTGWQPWYSGEQSGRLAAVFAKHGLKIQVQEMDYGPSIDAYTAGQLDAVVITNMDSLISPVKSGVDSTAVILGDFSNGNDKWETKDKKTSVCQEKGNTIYRLEASVSDYLIERGLQSCNMHDSDIHLANVSDSAVEGAFRTTAAMRSAVTWNPMALDLAKDPGTTVLFDSSKIPGEILDLLVVNTKTLNANPEVGKAFAEFWYNEMKLMQGQDKVSVEAQSLMAATAKNTLPFFQEQLKTTAMFYTPQSAVEFASSDAFVQKNDSVFKFCAERKLIDNTTAFGISFPNGQVLGNKNNVKFRYDTSYMQAQVGK